MSAEPGWARIPLRSFSAALRGELTVTNPEGESQAMYRIDGDVVCVPRAAVPGAEAEYALGRGERFVGIAPIELRGAQPAAVEAICTALQNPPHGTVLLAGCGQGKTVMGLEAARRLRVPTLVMVHKTFLMEQWEERCLQFLPGAKIGFWQQDRMDSGDDFDIVIGMVQSIVSKREYPPELFRSFGALYGDEVHRFAAPLWQQAVVKFPAKYRLGLTATPTRRDGMQSVFFSHIGPVGHVVESPDPPLEVYRVQLDTEVNPKEYVQVWDGEPNISKMVSALAKNPSRTARIVEYAVNFGKNGRKVLVLTDRVEHAKDIARLIPVAYPELSSGLYLGGTKQALLDKAAEADVVVGTYSMAAEGLDIPELDTLLLASPRTSVVQAAGRILRELPGKKARRLVDFVDRKVPICMSMWKNRKRQYEAQGYAVHGS